jgi:hypothetical protein
MRTNLNQPQLGTTMTELAEKAHASFEGKECIYIEKGALRVRISGICVSASQYAVSANVEEIPTPGLGVGLFDKESGFYRPRWKISAGFMTDFSEHSWHMGYGGWSLFFNHEIIQGVIELSSQFPSDMDTMKRYDLIMEYIQNQTNQPA